MNSMELRLHLVDEVPICGPDEEESCDAKYQRPVFIVLGPEFRQLQVTVQKMIDHWDLRPIIPEWDVNCVFVHKVADVQEWNGATGRSEEDQRLVFGCVRRCHLIEAMLFIAYIPTNSKPNVIQKTKCKQHTHGAAIETQNQKPIPIPHGAAMGSRMLDRRNGPKGNVISNAERNLFRSNDP
jgi:hypothetical protein